MLNFDMTALWRELPLCVVDTETTGLDPETGRIVEIGIVRFERGQVAERWSTLLDPGMPIPPDASRISGITDEMVVGKPSFRDVKWEIWGRLRDRVFVAYNADFDWRYVETEMRRAGLSMPELPVLDPLVWARALLPNERTHKLDVICERLGVSNPQAHRAEQDAETAGRVLLRLADKVSSDLGGLLTEQRAWKDTQEAAFAARRAAREAKAAATAPQGVPEPVKQTGLFG